jgi:hypothetical protein
MASGAEPLEWGDQMQDRSEQWRNPGFSPFRRVYKTSDDASGFICFIAQFNGFARKSRVVVFNHVARERTSAFEPCATL